MRSLTDTSFANTFTFVLDATNPKRVLAHWRADGVEWQRERLSYTGATYAWQCEVHTLAKHAKPAWRLLYVIETWWDETAHSVMRDTRWGRVLAGRQADVFAWFRAKAAARST